MTTSAEILEVVQVFLHQDVQEELRGPIAYENRIAANLLGMLRREQQLAPVRRTLDTRFAEEHGLDPAGMPASLSCALRDGAGPDKEALRSYLRRRTLLSMAIDNPRYSGFTAACAQWTESEGLEDR